jgi:hypothetical protein
MKNAMKRLIAAARAAVAAAGRLRRQSPPGAGRKAGRRHAPAADAGERRATSAPKRPSSTTRTLDVFGYYLTQATVVKSGSWQLKSINMGSPSDFASWEDGKHPSNFGPFFMEFEDVSSPTAENELGQVYHTVSFRLMPDSYKVGAGQVTFHATDPRVGEVLFSGGFDLAALKAVKAAGPGVAATTVLTGGLQVGAERIRNISFFYFAGD